MKRPEEALQIAVVAWLRVALPPGWRVHHSPNGGKRSKVEAARFKRMGTSAGFPDLIITGPGRALLAIELKSDKGRETATQSEWIEHLRTCGFTARVCRSAADVELLLTFHGVRPLRARVAA